MCKNILTCLKTLQKYFENVGFLGVLLFSVTCWPDEVPRSVELHRTCLEVIPERREDHSQTS